MASNALDNASTLSAARSDPTNLQTSNAPQIIAWTVIPTRLPPISSQMSTQMLTGSDYDLI